MYLKNTVYKAKRYLDIKKLKNQTFSTKQSHHQGKKAVRLKDVLYIYVIPRRWEQFGFVAMNLFVQTKAPLLYCRSGRSFYPDDDFL